MNARIFKVIFSKRLGTLVAVGEHASAQGKSASGEGARGAVLAATMLLAGLSSAYALDPSALPTGHQVAAGQVQVTTSGARMDIGQLTNQAIVNWQSFNVGSGASVQIQQPSATSVLLNRVVGNDMSQIRGQISANGQVVLVNPNGIVMGPTGRITASAFTASTFGISDANFQNGNMAFERNGSDGKVVHQGHIQTSEAGGYVALIGAEVSNEGTIQTRQGAVVLAAADTVSLPRLSDINNVSIPLSRSVRLEIDPSAFGSASVANSGVIQTSGGQVFLRAAAVVDAVSKIADARVSHNGNIDTTGEQGGRVDILADHGTVRVSGTVTADSTKGTVGGKVFIGRDEQTNVLAAVDDASGATLESKGGFVETSGSFLKVDDISVKAKDWLLDPTNIRIVTSPATPSTGSNTTGETVTFQDTAANTESQIQNTTINTALNNGVNVIISTGLRGISGDVGTQDGNIIVDANGADPTISQNSGGKAKLTLIANNSITLNGGISGTSTNGTLDVEMTAHGNPVNSANSQGITVNRAITTNGDVTLISAVQNTGSSNAITFNNGSGITANKYTVVGTQNGTANSSQGIVFSGTTSFKQTGNGDSSIRGTTKGASWPPSMGIYYLTGSNTTFDSGTGTTQVVGKLEGSGSSGTRTGFIGGVNITTKGNVTLGSNEQGATFFHRAGTIKAESGTLNILGSSIETYDPTSRIEGANGTTINLSAPSIRLGSTAGGSSQIAPTSDNITLNISADSLVVQPGSVSSSGAAGTTTIKNFNSATRIDLGGADVASTISTPATLGLSSAEIASFTAGNLVFGGDTAGDLVISTAITLNKIRIISNGNIDINAALRANTTTELADAIVIIAGKDKGVDQSEGGNIRIGSSGAINVEQGGVAKLFTGSIAETTGISGIAASGSGKFRYNSDETTANFNATNAPLLGKGGTNPNGVINANGVNIIYREATTIQLTANSTTSGLIYNGEIQTGTQSVTNTSNLGVLKNGDADARLTGKLIYIYNNNGVSEPRNAGTYTVTASGQKSDLGYKVDFMSGTLVIDPKTVTVNGLIAQDKAFDNSTTAQWSGAAELVGKVTDDNLILNVSAANFNSPDVGNNKPVTLTGVLEGNDKGNYTLVLPVLTARITNSIEPVVPPTPVVPVTPPSNPNVVVSVAAANNNFQLAGAEGQCSADTLEECECESASSPAGEALDGIQICFASGSSTKE